MTDVRTLELGVYSFGNTPRNAAGTFGSSAQAIRNLLEAVRLADEVGLDFFGFGEHHTRSMPVSSPTSLINAAAASTSRIKLGTAVSVLPTDDPIRVYQQLATAAALAPGRVEMVAGRGSSTMTFPLFDLEEKHCDTLFASKLGLLLEINRSERISWSGGHRWIELKEALIVPRPETPLPIWLGSGGSPRSVARAAELGLPLFLGILGGSPAYWSQYGDAYRAGWRDQGHTSGEPRIAIAVHGFVGASNGEAKDQFQRYEAVMFETAMAELGKRGGAPQERAADLKRGGMVFAGDPAEIVDRILHLHSLVGHSRQIFQMDPGGIPHREFMKSIELLGTDVLPNVRRYLG